MTDVEMLDGEVRFRTGTGPTSTVAGPSATKLVGLLAVAAPEPIQVADLLLELGCDRAALHTAITRLRRRGFPIPASARGGDTYSMDMPDARVDAAQFLAGARISSRMTADQVLSALSLWRSGPPECLSGTTLWRDLHRAKEELERCRDRLVRRRLLIVEDRVGERLCQVLGEYDCTLVRDLAEFWAVADRLDASFDGALVDLHLQHKYGDRDGEVVLGVLSSRTAIPAVVMTYRVPGGLDVVEFQRRYNLLSVVTKQDDGPHGDFSKVADVVRAMFAADTHAALFEMLEDRLPRLRRQAERQLRHTGHSERVAAMHRQYEQLGETVRGGDLALLRTAVRRFEADFGLRPDGDGQ